MMRDTRLTVCSRAEIQTQARWFRGLCAYLSALLPACLTSNTVSFCDVGGFSTCNLHLAKLYHVLYDVTMYVCMCVYVCMYICIYVFGMLLYFDYSLHVIVDVDVVGGGGFSCLLAAVPRPYLALLQFNQFL